MGRSVYLDFKGVGRTNCHTIVLTCFLNRKRGDDVNDFIRLCQMFILCDAINTAFNV